VDFDNQQGVVILHLLRRGTLRLAHPPAASIELSEPTLLFYRQPFAHRFEVDSEQGWTLDELAQTLLKRGKPMKVVAPAVGYSSTAAFSRVFAKRLGISAVDWLKTGAALSPHHDR